MQNNNTKTVVRIKIAGVGGGGTNVINRMSDENIPLVSYISINTDNSAMHCSKAEASLQIGKRITNGYGAGADAEKGRLAAEENRKEIEAALGCCDMLFIAAGMGGGTGTGATPIVAEIARKLGILTVAVVTTPFTFEGKKRADNARLGIAELEKYVDSIIIIPNENIKKVSPTRITLQNAFSVADDVLVRTVKNLVGVIQNTAFINCDFADITTTVKDSGHMYTAYGCASGDNRAQKIIEQIENSELLGTSVDDATNILLCITAAKDAGLDEIDSISAAVTDRASPEARVIFGMDFDENAGDEIRAVLIATKKNSKKTAE